MDKEAATVLADKASEAVSIIGAKMAELGAKYGPDVLDATLGVVRVDAIGKLLIGFVALMIFIGLLTVILKMWLSTRFEDEAKVFAVFLLGIPLLLCLAVLGTQWLNVWNWAGLFAPKLWIAHRILEKVL